MLELILSAATASLMLCSAAYAGMPPASSQLSSSGLIQIKHQGGDDRGPLSRADIQPDGPEDCRFLPF